VKVLDVIAVISNPARYKRRYELFKQFEQYILSHANVRLHVVELAYGNRPHEVTDPLNPRHVQVRTNEELWHKENMFNIGMQILPDDAEYVCMIDADVRFVRPDWVEETIHKLQHYPVVQMFSHCNMLGPKYFPVQPMSISFAYAHQRSLPSFDPGVQPVELKFGIYGGTPHKTGLAWGYRRDVLEKMGGLMDTCIIGSADYHMAAAFINKTEWSIPVDADGPYRDMIVEWQSNAYPLIEGRVGFVDGLIVHYWHGKMKDRRYRERWNIVKNFDPQRHLQRDWRNRGLLMLTDSGRRTDLWQHMTEYMNLRNEDSIDE
jgi:hypothetical protein